MNPPFSKYLASKLYRLMKQLGNYDLFINTTQSFQQSIMLYILGKTLVKSDNASLSE